MAKAGTMEERPAAKTEEIPSPPRKSPLRFVLLIVVLVVLGGGGFAAWKKVIQPALVARTAGKAGKGSTASGSLADNGLMGPFFPLDTFIVNLAGDEGRRFLKVTMDLELSDGKLKEEINRRMPEIRDAILVLLSSKTYDDVETVQGKFKLRAEIVSRINAFLQSGRVEKVFFTEFVMQ